MNKRFLTIVFCAVALTAAGCSGQSKDSATTSTEQETKAAESTATADTTAAAENTETAGNTQAGGGDAAEETVKELTPEEAAAAERKEKAEADATEQYESEDGWSVRYNSELVDLEEGKDYVRFTYNSDANATNRIDFHYYPNTFTDLVLAEATIDYDREELTRSEGYFGGDPDMWCFNVDLVSDGRYSTRGYTAVEYNDGVLLIERRGSIETDEERGMQISDTMAAIVDTIEFRDPQPQKEYDYVPGKYVLAEKTQESDSKTAKTTSAAADYPAYVELTTNHLGTIGYAEPVDIIWYCRDGIIREDNESGKIHYYDIEGEYFYLEIGDNWVEYYKEQSGEEGDKDIAESEKNVCAFKTYESDNGWYVYYDTKKFTVKESWDEVNFLYGTSNQVTEDSEKLRIEYIWDDNTEDVLEDETRKYEASQLVWDEGYVGGGKEAWGLTVSLPASEGAAGARKLTAVEHNEGVLLFDRPDHSGEDSEEGVGNGFEDIINTFMFTDHDQQKEYDDVPGRYIINDKKLSKAATNYPTRVRLNKDHSGAFSGNIEKDITWYGKNKIIVEAGPEGVYYNYSIDDDTLYIEMNGERVEYNKEDRDDDW